MGAKDTIKNKKGMAKYVGRHTKQDNKFCAHYVEWTDNKIEKYWDIYQTHPALFRTLIFLQGTNKNVLLDDVVNESCRLVPRGSKILDIGFGNGYVVKKMALRGYKCFGVDISERNVSLTLQEILKNKQLSKTNIELKVGNILQLSSIFGNNMFDLIIATEVLEHLRDKTLYKGLLEMGRCLKEGGYLFVTTPYKEVLGRSLVLCPDCHAIFHPVGHLQSFDEKRMTDMLKSHNFRVVKCTPDHHSIVARVLHAIYSKLVRKYGSSQVPYTQNLYTIAQKSSRG